MQYRDLETTRALIKDATGLDLAYAYDDLVFPDHSIFMLQFSDSDFDKLKCYFRTDCKSEDQIEIYNKLSNSGLKFNCSIEIGGNFDLIQNGNNVDISFS